MIIHTHKDFDKSFNKLTKNLKNKTLERIVLFRQNPYDSLLSNHELHSPYVGCRSFNVTGDVRVIFYIINSETVQLLDVGTHSELYG